MVGNDQMTFVNHLSYSVQFLKPLNGNLKAASSLKVRMTSEHSIVTAFYGKKRHIHQFSDLNFSFCLRLGDVL